MALNFVAIDIETAASTWDTICSVALVRVVDGSIIDEYASLINPECDFNPQNVRVHGITPLMVAGAPTFGDAALEILDFIEDDILISHNISFDANVLQRDLRRYNQPIPDIRTFCTLACAKLYNPNLVNHQLPTICAEYGVELNHHHDALDDARACAYAMIAMARKMEADSIDDVLSILHCDYGLISDDRVISPRSLTKQSIYGTRKSATKLFNNPFSILEQLKAASPDISNEIEMSQLKDPRTIAYKCSDSVLFYLTIGKVSTFIKASDDYDMTSVSVNSSVYKDGSIKIPIDSKLDVSKFIDIISRIAKDRYDANTAAAFGCCNDFVMCSDALRCLKAGDPFYKGCMYRKNLEAGRIFYGIHKGISPDEYLKLKQEMDARPNIQRTNHKVPGSSQPRTYTGRAILQMTDDGTIVNEFRTIAAAVRETRINSKSIRDAANGVQKHAGGFCWQYADKT